MAVCVGCGLVVNGGLLEVHRDPAGGIECGPNGLSVAAAIAGGDDGAMAAAAAAQTSANNAQSSANAAQSSANAANSSASYRARLYAANQTQAPVDLPAPAPNTPLLVQGGTYVGVTNGSGDFTLVFPAAFPTACLSITANAGAEDFPNFIAFHDSGNSSQIAVRIYNHDGTPYASNTIRIVYTAMGY